MTEENDDLPDPEIADALASEGFIDSAEGGDSDDEQNEESKVGGLIGKVGDIAGSGKSLEAYENDPIASIFTDDGEPTPKGAKHIARGVDGLSPFAATHPFIDIAVGFLLLKAEGKIDGSPLSGGDDSRVEKKPEDGDDSDSRGDMLT